MLQRKAEYLQHTNRPCSLHFRSVFQLLSPKNVFSHNPNFLLLWQKKRKPLGFELEFLKQAQARMSVV